MYKLVENLVLSPKMKFEFHMQKLFKVKVDLIEFLKSCFNFNVFYLDIVQYGFDSLLNLLKYLQKYVQHGLIQLKICSHTFRQRSK